MDLTDPHVQELLKKNITPSHQRVMILKYLLDNQCHPTVDQIFSALRDQIPTLSKATIYNTLHVLIEAKLVRVLSIEEHETRYDILMEDHGHFKCSSCGRIYNFAVDFNRLISDDLREFRSTQKNVHFSGICPNCLAKTEV